MKIAIAVTGASGAIYAKLLIEKLQLIKEPIEETAVVFSNNALDVWKHELGEEWTEKPGVKQYKPNDFYAPFASGSAGWDSMIICPCSMGTLGRIASGVSNDLITRAADVMLKERKKLVLVPRELPYNLIHINNMKLVTEAGAIICPASPSFYSKPNNIEELSSTVVDRVLSLAGFNIESYKWGDKQT